MLLDADEQIVDDAARTASGGGSSWFWRLLKAAIIVGLLLLLIRLTWHMIQFFIVLDGVKWVYRQIKDEVGINRYLVVALAILSYPIASYIISNLFTRDTQKRWKAILFTSLLAMAGSGFMYLATRGHLLGRCVSDTPEGLVFDPPSGRDPKSGIPCEVVTQEKATQITLLREREFFRVDPDRSDWFHPTVGLPLLYVSRNPDGTFGAFYSRNGYDPESGLRLQPVSVQMKTEWLAQREKKTNTLKR
jgi:hypothetical protein